MADKQLSLKQDADDNLFADDDPLAALARIASFEPQGETRLKPLSARREPEFNLEDELLKEFEQYEEPAASAVVPEVQAEPVSALEPRLFDAEPAFDEPALQDDGTFDSQTIFGDEAPAAAPVLTVEPEAPVRPPVPELRAVSQPSFVGPTEPIRPASHPVFDLEDEILKEFAAFDARRAPNAPIAPAPQVQVPEQAPAVEPEWKPAAAASARVEPEFVEGRREEDQRYRAFRDEFAKETVAAAQPVAPVAPAVVAEPVVAAEPALDLPALDAMEAEVDPDRWNDTKASIFAGEETRVASPSVDESIEEPALLEVEPTARERWDDEIATEAAAPFDNAAELQPMLDIDAEPDVYDAADDFAAAAPVIPAVAPVLPPIVESKVVPRSERQPVIEIARQPAQQSDLDLDELLADVERFPVQPAAVARAVPTPQAQEIASAPETSKPIAQTEAAWRTGTAQAVAVPATSQGVASVVESKANIARDEDLAETQKAKTATPEAEPVALQHQPLISAPAIADVEKTAVASRVETVIPSVAKAVEPTTSVEPVAKSTEPTVKAVSSWHVDDDDHEVFDEAAFELDLTEIELDMLEMEVASSVAPALHEDNVTASEAALADIADATVPAKPSVAAERRFEPQPKPVEDYSSLPFDPSQISTEEDPVLAISEMDVPETPAVDHGEEPVPAEPDYDIDIDAEMAHIFARPTEHAPATTAKTASQPAQPAPQLSATDLDEFERALEEDFRRSLSENRATSTPDRVALTPAAIETGRRQGSTGRRILVLAASVAGLVLIGSAAVYAYWGHSGRLLASSGEPKIILADKDPVKVEPKERGGQIVPNQDKAVYDRVSGENKELTKQDRLVTSNEEPVDVVQKTLMPEALPQDDDQTSATDTNDTTDPRLLPDQQDKNVSTDAATDSVSPRKVRTMVVRSDGTLVPRDEEPVVAKDKTPAEQSQDRSLDIAPASAEDVPERLTANDDIAKQINQANADKSFVPEAKQPADATDKSAQNTDAKTSVTADQPAATDTAKTADQPAQDQATTTDQSATPTATEASTKTDKAATTTDQATTADQATSTTTDPAATATDQQATATDSASDVKPDTVPVKTQDLAAATPSDATADKTAETAATTTDVKPADASAATDTATDKSADQPVAATDTTQSDDAVQPTKDKAAKLSKMPIPANRPVDQPVDIVGRVTDQGNVKNQEVASADQASNQPAETTTPAGAYVIQIASLPSEAEAQKSFTKLSARFASVIGGHSVDIRKAAIKNKGTYYRVRVIAGTKQEATELCSRYKAAGGSCLVSK